MAQLFANAARAVTTASIAAVDTSFSITSGGSLFPVANTGTSAAGTAGLDWFKAVLQDADGLEIVYVRTHTSGSTSFSNVVRGQDGTSARAFASGAVLGIRVTAEDMRLATGPYYSPIVAMSALDINCGYGNYFTKTINGNSTFTVSSVPSGVAYSFTLELTHTSGTVTWFTGVEWPGGTAPTLTTGKTHLFTFVTDDGGARWRASSLVNYTN